MKKVVSIFWFPVLLSFCLGGCQSHTLYKDTQVLMGTFIEVISPDKDAGRIVLAEFKRIEDLLSKYKETSEVSQLNKLGEVKASPDTLYVIKKSKEFYGLSGGAFDITVGPLITLWGFTTKHYRVPTEYEIRKTRALVGSNKIIVDENNFKVRFSSPGMSIDLGAIGKGFALDCALRELKKHNINSCLINAGGQIYCLGKRFGRPWRIALKDAREGEHMKIRLLENQGVSTSGDYEQYFLHNGKRYSHIFDPKTGYPVDNGVVSVTVIAENNLVADALSTTIFVMGKEKGMALLKHFPGVQAQVVEVKDIVKAN